MYPQKKEGFTLHDICYQTAEKYRQMYKEEDETTPTVDDKSELNENTYITFINRPETYGTYGIGLHVITDLMMHSIQYYEKNNIIILNIDS